MMERRKIDVLESERLELQATLDGAKTASDRNHMGQFATPTTLAREILSHGIQFLPKSERIRFFDPAIGTGSFYSALRAVTHEERIESAVGFEIDQHYGEPTRAFWKDFPLQIFITDFTQATPEGQGANLLICNPPYVRHHHLGSERKTFLQQKTLEACGVKISGLAGLYCYFMGLSHTWMAKDGIAGWLIPGEFMSVNYGQMLKRYLLEKVTLLQIHRYDPQDVQFDDALVSSTVIWIKNTPPVYGATVNFSFGGTLAFPSLSRRISSRKLAHERKWTRYPHSEKGNHKKGATLGDLFEIKRGLVTGDNSFFILDRTQIETFGLPIECFTPVLPSSRYIPTDEIQSDEDGLPKIDKQMFLLDIQLDYEEIAKKYPALKVYLDSGQFGNKAVANRYLCRFRKPWYSQENRPPAPIICTYMGRNKNGKKPFRFILNWSQATACNVFLMLYPKPILAESLTEKPELIKVAWKFLNGVDSDELLSYGRVYGGGLYKLEPKELRAFPAEKLINRLNLLQTVPIQGDLFD